VRDILAVELSPAMLDGLSNRYPSPGTLGNDLGVRACVHDTTAVCKLGLSEHVAEEVCRARRPQQRPRGARLCALYNSNPAASSL